MKQVKSKQRVMDHGEVMTAEREVNAMLDLVKQETERIDSRFLEPACGDGNFLAEILRRKLAVVKRQYYPRRRSIYDYELNAVRAVMSIYGVELLQDNVDACRKRLFDIFNEEYTAICKKQANDECRDAVRFVLSRNILCGDALTLMDSNGRPIAFSEWSFPFNDYRVLRRDFELAALMQNDSPINTATADSKQLSLFKDDWEFDAEINAFIPAPIKEYPLIHFKKVSEQENE